MNPVDESQVRQILAKGLASEAQIAEARGIQQRMEEMGLRARSIGEVLCEKGHMEVEDLEVMQREERSFHGRDQIAGYKLLELLGRGALGPTYRAEQLSLDRQVAIKLLDPEEGRDEQRVQRFLTEARAVAKLSHTNLISGIDVGEDDGIRYLVMEYADGVSLARLLRRGGALDEERAVMVALQIARALDYAHKQGLVHGDVRPENVILTSGNVAKLCELGHARREEGEGGSSRATPDYVSPEQARGHAEVGPAADLYGLGATLYHMLTGRPPFLADSREAVLAKHLTEPVPSIRALDASLSQATDALVQGCLHKNPAERPSSADLVQALDATLTTVQASRGSAPAAPSSPVAGTPAAPPSAAGGAPTPRRRRRRR